MPEKHYLHRILAKHGLTLSEDLVLEDTPVSTGSYNVLVVNSTTNKVEKVSSLLGVETDPVFTASPAGNITNLMITNWNTAYSWGNHSTAGYLTSIPTLQEVTDEGATTTNGVSFEGGVTISGNTPTAGWGTEHLYLVHDGSAGVGGGKDNSITIANTGGGSQGINLMYAPSSTPGTYENLQFYHYLDKSFEINFQGSDYKYIPISVNNTSVANYNVLIGYDFSIGGLMTAGSNRLAVRASTSGSTENILNLVDVDRVNKFRVRADGVILSNYTTSDEGKGVLIFTEGYTGALPLQGRGIIIGGSITNSGNSGYTVNIGGIDFGGVDCYFNTLVGYNTQVTVEKPKNTIIGAIAKATSSDGVAVGYLTTAGTFATAVGSQSTASGQYSAAFGAGVVNSTNYTHVYGAALADGISNPITHRFNGTVLMGTSVNNGSSALQVNGDIETIGSSKGFVTKSPNNTRWRITVDNSGVISATSL